MDILWSTWRSKYIQGFKDEETNPNNQPCFICEAGEDPKRDKELLVVARREKCFVMLNKFPYNGGHVLVAPYKHVGRLDELSDEEMFNIMQTVREATDALCEISKPHGYNIGINLGRVSGAGLPGHLHVHIVPRWSGDTSFMPILSDTKVVSQSMEEIQELLSDAFKKISSKK